MKASATQAADSSVRSTPQDQQGCSGSINRVAWIAKATMNCRTPKLVADATFGCGVAFAGVHDPLQFLAFLVGDGKRAAVGGDELYFYFAIFAIGGGVGRWVRDAVLVAGEFGRTGRANGWTPTT